MSSRSRAFSSRNRAASVHTRAFSWCSRATSSRNRARSARIGDAGSSWFAITGAACLSAFGVGCVFMIVCSHTSRKDTHLPSHLSVLRFGSDPVFLVLVFVVAVNWGRLREEGRRNDVTGKYSEILMGSFVPRHRGCRTPRRILNSRRRNPDRHRFFREIPLTDQTGHRRAKDVRPGEQCEASGIPRRQPGVARRRPTRM